MNRIAFIFFFLAGLIACGEPFPSYTPLKDEIEIDHPAAETGEGAVSSGEDSSSDESSTSTSASSSSSSSSSDSTSSGEEASEDLTPAFLYINELYYDIVGSDTEGDVFIELYGEADKSLAGYQIVFVNGDDGKIYKSIVMKSEHVIGDDGLFVVADSDSNGASKVGNYDMLDNFDPQNGPDATQLIDSKGLLVDAVAYGPAAKDKAENGLATYLGRPAVDAPSGSSVSRLPDADPSGDNSIDYIINTVPSPGSFDVTPIAK